MFGKVCIIAIVDHKENLQVCFQSANLGNIAKHGSKINTDRFPTLERSGGMLPRKILILDLSTPKSPFLGF